MSAIRQRDRTADVPPATAPGRSRVDLHLHSTASGAATNWWVQCLGLGIPVQESCTAPQDAYALARAAGMDFVTLTDHETMEGVLALRHLPDVVAGVEIGTVFPDDGSTVDVLVYGLDAGQLEELQALRPDVHRLVDALRQMDLPYALAHPLFAPEGQLTRTMVERRMVLFGAWETVNGSRPDAQNRLAARIAASADASMLRQLAVIHRMAQPAHRRIAAIAGSDDHGGVYVGTTWTETPRIGAPADLLEALRVGETWVAGDDGSVDRMVHTGCRLASHALGSGGSRETATDRAGRLAEALPLLSLLSTAQVRRMVEARYRLQLGAALSAQRQPMPALALLAAAGKLVEAHTPLAPHLGVHGYFGRERRKARDLAAAFPLSRPEPLRVGVFVDGLDATHGVSTFYRAIVGAAVEGDGAEIALIHCASGGEGLVLEPVGTVPMPLYGEGELAVPSLLDVVDTVARLDLDVVHVATPGPLGIAAFVAARVRGLPVVGAYHTEFGAYARQLSGDAMLGELIDLAVRECCERCDALIVPSRATVDALARRGYRTDRIEVVRNGVDAELFHPCRRDEALRQCLGGGRDLLVYCGRISREKGLEDLAEAYLALRARRDDVHLVLIGDGPLRADLEERLGAAASFTGLLHGNELARILASGDVFVFPSLTDTLGRAVTEAQACGLPAVVFAGGPAECIVAGRTGFAVPAGDFAVFIDRVEALLDEPDRRRRMGIAGRDRAAAATWPQARAGLVALYRDLARRSARPRGPLVASSQVAAFSGVRA